MDTAQKREEEKTIQFFKVKYRIQNSMEIFTLFIYEQI